MILTTISKAGFHIQFLYGVDVLLATQPEHQFEYYFYKLITDYLIYVNPLRKYTQRQVQHLVYLQQQKLLIYLEI
ncbi:hypothetical protein pb186bvf_016072 [Paramecium bursaria]